MFNEISLLYFICERRVILWKVILNLGLEVRGNEVVRSSVRAVLQLRRVSEKKYVMFTVSLGFLEAEGGHSDV
jgi:hypothetical protein